MVKAEYVLLFRAGDAVLVDGRVSKNKDHLQVCIYPTAARARQELCYDPLMEAILSQLNPRYLKVTGDLTSELDFLRGSSITPNAPLGGPLMPELRRTGIHFKDSDVATTYYSKAEAVTL